MRWAAHEAGRKRTRKHAADLTIAIVLGAIGALGCEGAPAIESDAGAGMVCGSPDDLLPPHRLEELEGCTEYRGHIHISDDSTIEDLRSLRGLRAVGRLSLFRNPQLARASGLEDLETVETLGFSMNDALVDLSALRRLSWAKDELYVDGNGSLEELTGLEGVLMVGSLHISSNARLRSLAGLAGLVRVDGDLTITGNPMLSEAEVLAFVARVSVGGTIDVSGNAVP